VEETMASTGSSDRYQLSLGRRRRWIRRRPNNADDEDDDDEERTTAPARSGAAAAGSARRERNLPVSFSDERPTVTAPTRK
jgi:hypothetical protein